MRQSTIPFVAAFAALGLLSGCEEAQAPPKAEVIRPVRALKVADVSNFEQRWFSGRAEGVQEIDLAFRVAGPLISRNANVGDEVDEGDIVAQIDPATFRADVSRAEADLARAEANLANAADQLQKQRQLVERGLYKETRLDSYIASEQEASANVAAQKASLERNRLDLAYTTLRAPFKGVVVQTYVENFQDVQAKQAVVRLVDNSKVEMTINIPETLISQADAITKGIVVFDAYPDLKVPATLKEIGREASEITRTYPVTISMDQPEGVKILPGMAGKATADPSAVEAFGSTIIIPETAIMSQNTESPPEVWVIDETSKQVARRTIETGVLADQGVVVTAGLEPGELIVTAGVHNLTDGQVVRLLKEQ